MRAIPVWGRIALAVLVVAVVAVVGVVVASHDNGSSHALPNRSHESDASVPIATAAAPTVTTTPVPEPVVTTEPPPPETAPPEPAPAPASVTSEAKPQPGPQSIVVGPKTWVAGTACGMRGDTGVTADGRALVCGGPAGGPPTPLVWVLS